MSSSRLDSLIVAWLLGLMATLCGCNSKNKPPEPPVPPPLPVHVSFRESKITKGLVCSIRNDSGKHLQIKSTFSSRTTGQTQEKILTLLPAETLEVGFLEGWRFTSGETVKLWHADFQEKVVQVP